jgi:hypothetical protein
MGKDVWLVGGILRRRGRRRHLARRIPGEALRRRKKGPIRQAVVGILPDDAIRDLIRQPKELQSLPQASDYPAHTSGDSLRRAGFLLALPGGAPAGQGNPTDP